MTTRGEVWQAEVMAIMRRRAGSVSAYDVLDGLREKNPKVAPPTVYRALAALTDQGLIHRLESVNAFALCRCEGDHQASVLTICNDCGDVDEKLEPNVISSLTDAVSKTGFAPQRHVIEIHGVCASCGEGQTSS